jgi:PII-like signaling protein
MTTLLKRARRAKLAGATVFEGHEGYGASGHIHRSHVLSDDSPISVVFVDLPDRIEAFLNDVSDLLVDVLVTVDDIDVVEIWSCTLRHGPVVGLPIVVGATGRTEHVAQPEAEPLGVDVGVATDLSDDAVRTVALPRGLVDNKVCALDAMWSALRLVWRRENRWVIGSMSE